MCFAHAMPISCSIKCETILLPFLCSVASNGTCGFSMFSSSEKERLQVQCQTALSMKWAKSQKLHQTHYFFLNVWARFFFCWTQRNTFWISFLETGKLVSNEVGGNLIISNQQKHIWRKPGEKLLFSPRASNLW